MALIKSSVCICWMNLVQATIFADEEISPGEVKWLSHGHPPNEWQSGRQELQILSGFKPGLLALLPDATSFAWKEGIHSPNTVSCQFGWTKFNIKYFGEYTWWETIIIIIIERKSKLGNFYMMYYLILFSPSFVLSFVSSAWLTSPRSTYVHVFKEFKVPQYIPAEDKLSITTFFLLTERKKKTPDLD